MDFYFHRQCMAMRCITNDDLNGVYGKTFIA